MMQLIIVVEKIRRLIDEGESPGRAVLKAADYQPPHEQPDEEYPFWLSTGRVVYHFHTRTKTGRSKKLRDAAPDAFVQIS